MYLLYYFIGVVRQELKGTDFLGGHKMARQDWKLLFLAKGNCPCHLQKSLVFHYLPYLTYFVTCKASGKAIFSYHEVRVNVPYELRFRFISN